jgi:hypothetical protein
MGAHSAPGQLRGSTLTAATGVAAALVTTGATGVLTGGTALATDDSGHGHSHGGHSRSHGHQQVDRDDDSADALASQTLCDVLGDVPLGVGASCPGSGEGSSDEPSDGDPGRGASSGPGQVTPTAMAGRGGAQPVGASAAPAAPKPPPASTVPAEPQLLPIPG